MSFFEVKTILAVLFVAAGLAAVASMMALMGRSERRMSVPALKTIHRVAGYTFSVLLVVLAVMGLKYLSAAGDSLSVRGVLHWSIASMLVFVLALKIVVVRWFKQFLKFAPVMGMIVIILALVVAMLSAVFFLVTGGFGGTEQGVAGVELRRNESEVLQEVGAEDMEGVQKEVGSKDAHESAKDESSAGPAGEDPSASADHGEEVFEANCSNCHYDDSADNKIGPGLAGLFQRDRIRASGKAMTPGNVRGQITDPAGSMPSFEGYLTDEQLDDLLSYLETL